MSAPEEKRHTPKHETRAREGRLSRALRENLRRRKDQARKRAATAEPYAENEPESERPNPKSA